MKQSRGSLSVDRSFRAQSINTNLYWTLLLPSSLPPSLSLFLSFLHCLHALSHHHRQSPHTHTLTFIYTHIGTQQLAAGVWGRWILYSQRGKVWLSASLLPGEQSRGEEDSNYPDHLCLFHSPEWLRFNPRFSQISVREYTAQNSKVVARFFKPSLSAFNNFLCSPITSRATDKRWDDKLGSPIKSKLAIRTPFTIYASYSRYQENKSAHFRRATIPLHLAFFQFYFTHTPTLIRRWKHKQMIHCLLITTEMLLRHGAPSSTN